MSDDRMCERLARAWLDLGPTEAPERAVQAALLRIDETSQERDWHIPWRTARMNGLVRALAGTAAVAVALVLAVALGATVLGSGGRLPAGAAPIGSEPTSPAAATAEPTLDPAIVEAMKLREQWGLRADQAWVKQVAQDPSATREYGVPLLPSEKVELGGRPVDSEGVISVLQAYGSANPDEFGGLFIDRQNGETPTALFTGNLGQHEAAIRAKLRPGARFAVGESRFTERELRALQERIVADDPVLRAEGIAAIVVGADPIAGTVPVEISTERTDAAAVLAARYGPAVRVTVLDPTGAYLKPPGVIEGRVVDPQGRPVRDGALDQLALFGDIGLDTIGIGFGSDGRFRLERMLPGPWRITAEKDGFESASVVVDVPPGGVATIEIVLRPAP